MQLFIGPVERTIDVGLRCERIRIPKDKQM